MTINFYLDSKLLSDGTKRIYCFVRGIEPQKSTMINTKIKIEPDNWNSNKQEVKRSAKLYSQMNIHLNQIKEKIEKLYLEELSAHSNLTKKEFDIVLKENLFKDEKRSGLKSTTNKFLLYYFKQFIESKSTSLVHNSIVKYDALYNHLLAYQSTSNTQITFDMIDMDFFDKFKNYLIRNKNLNNNSTNSIFKLLKSYLNWCNERGYYKDLTYKNFSIKTFATEVYFLTQEELNRIINLDLKENSTLEKVRDVFIFQCYTGQRYTDVYNLKFLDISDDIWNLRTQKTRDIIKIKLVGQALAIYNKYKQMGDSFKALSNKRANVYLKTIGIMAKIDTPTQKISYVGEKRIEKTAPKYEFITTHIARKTFVTLSIENGILPDVIMKITGHKSYDVFKKYEKITSKLVDKEMARVWDNIN